MVIAEKAPVFAAMDLKAIVVKLIYVQMLFAEVVLFVTQVTALSIRQMSVIPSVLRVRSVSMVTA
jgi:hypothetical protein